MQPLQIAQIIMLAVSAGRPQKTPGSLTLQVTEQHNTKTVSHSHGGAISRRRGATISEAGGPCCPPEVAIVLCILRIHKRHLHTCCLLLVLCRVLLVPVGLHFRLH